MRTTTKRGLGRGAAVNGNGRSVLPPDAGSLAPPGFTRYRQPPPPRRSALGWAARIVLWVVAAAAVVGSGLAGGAYLYFHQTVSEITGRAIRDPDVRRAAEQLEIAPAGEPATALVIGYDKRAGREREETPRSDTIMLLRADPRTDVVSMLSFPRDLLVEIRCPGRPPFVSRINAAFSDCGRNGVRGVLQTVRGLTGLPINYLITVNFRGFKQVVAKLGGVWVDVDRRYFNDNSDGGPRYAAIDLHAGYQKLNGSQALDFVRYRHLDSDLYRLARQQLFVQSFKQAVGSSFSPLKVPKVVKVVRDNVVIGAARGEVSGRTLVRYGLFAYDLPAGHFFQTKIDFGCLADVVSPSGEYGGISAAPGCVADAVQAFASPDPDAPDKATDVALGRKPRSSPAPPPAKTSLVVLNGNRVAGAAAEASSLLRARGYVTLDPPAGERANAPGTTVHGRTVVYFDRGRRGARAGARTLARLLGGARVDALPQAGPLPYLANGAMLLAVVGKSFTGRLASEPIDQTPRRQRPAVADNPRLTRDLLRPLVRKVPFPVLLPSVVESSSTLAAAEPVRLYSIAGHRTIRLTFAKSAGEYWGIQMVAWNEAPALAAPNRVVTLKGRRYELHYTGPRLHMVVLRRGPATYWVVNTLVNSLSNETMLAIARGLRPLAK